LDGIDQQLCGNPAVGIDLLADCPGAERCIV
jgi:hypothetical protein